MSAPAISVAAIVLAVILVWYFRPQPDVAPEPESPAPDEQAAASTPPRSAAASTPASPASAAAPSEQTAAAPPATPERSALPGEAPTTPMAQMLADRQQNVIVQNKQGDSSIPERLVEEEREFTAEPVDGAWAPGAEAKLLSTFAQIPGLQLIDLQVHCRSTMCRLQLTQPPAPAGSNGRLPFSILRDDVGMTPRWMMAIPESNGPPGPPQPGAAPRSMRSIAYLWREGFAPKRDASARTDGN